MLYVFSFCGMSQNILSKFIITEDMLSYARPFVACTVCPIASVLFLVVKYF